MLKTSYKPALSMRPAGVTTFQQDTSKQIWNTTTLPCAATLVFSHVVNAWPLAWSFYPSKLKAQD